MTDDLPDPSDREIVQLMAAQQTVLDHHEQLDAEYKQNIRDLAEKNGVEVNV